MRLFRVLFTATLTAIVLFGICLILASRFLHYAEPVRASSLPIAPSLFSTTDTITIWLGLLGLMIGLASLVVTGVGLVVGALAIFGFQTFRDEVTRRVSEATATEINQYFGGPNFKRTLENSVKKHVQPKSRQSEAATEPTTIPEIKVKRYPKQNSSNKNNAKGGPKNSEVG